MSKRRLFAALAATTLALVAAPFVFAPRPTSHPAAPASLGTPRSGADLDAIVDQPGPVTVETIVGADWSVSRAGLINLDDPKAKEAKLEDGPMPIVIVFHALHHPTEGLYLVDTGVERALRDDPDHAALRGTAANYMGVREMKYRTVTASWIAAQHEPVKGVFLTHLHLDHISGMRDVPNDAVVYTGPGESEETSALNFFVRGIADRELEGKGTLQEWRFQPDPSGAFEGVLDVFGDGTVWALRVPGHTAGSTAYVARTPNGPVLFTGDASHTVWGWEHGVEPGDFSHDKPRSAESLAHLRAFAQRHPGMDVRLGHELFPAQKESAARADAR